MRALPDTNVVAIEGPKTVHRHSFRRFPWPLCMERSRSATKGHYQATDQAIACKKCKGLP